MYDKLFEPIKIGTLELKNRMVVSALSTLDAEPDGSCTEQRGPPGKESTGRLGTYHHRILWCKAQCRLLRQDERHLER